MFTLPTLLYLKLLPLFGQCMYHVIVPNKSRPPHAGGALPSAPLPALHPFWVGRASVGIFAPYQREIGNAPLQRSKSAEAGMRITDKNWTIWSKSLEIQRRSFFIWRTQSNVGRFPFGALSQTSVIFHLAYSVIRLKYDPREGEGASLTKAKTTCRGEGSGGLILKSGRRVDRDRNDRLMRFGAFANDSPKWMN
ncbi:hypothetical protein AVEN_96539-1 [Araneus ventricosus]|uniref:Secreted protein n=1 Tax=Araneus ventricosus TaxID=182803 RepID=A0A4Y2JSG2_ARAVE|nr:hypothetical protein AVEN_96539-1 [Araneus ventricosus]